MLVGVFVVTALSDFILKKKFEYVDEIAEQVQSAVFREQKDYNLPLTGLFVEDKQIIRDVDWSTKAFFPLLWSMF